MSAPQSTGENVVEERMSEEEEPARSDVKKEPWEDLDIPTVVERMSEEEEPAGSDVKMEPWEELEIPTDVEVTVECQDESTNGKTRPAKQSSRSDARLHKFTEAFEESFSRPDAVEIDVAVDDSANAEAPGIMKRKRPCGRNAGNDFEERKLQLLKEEFDAKTQFMAQMLANENRKVELLQQLVGSITSEKSEASAGLANLLK